MLRKHALVAGVTSALILVLMLSTNPTDNSAVVVLIWFGLAFVLICTLVDALTHRLLGGSHPGATVLAGVSIVYLLAVNTLGQLTIGDVLLVWLFAGLVAFLGRKFSP